MYFDILLPLKLDKTYCYCSEKDLPIGSFIRVNFNGRETIGIVKEVSQKEPTITIKNILSVIDLPPMQISQITFLEWVAKYNLTPMGLVLKMSLAKQMLPEEFFILSHRGLTAKKYQKIAQIFTKETSQFPLNYFDILLQSNIRDSTFQALVADGVLLKVEKQLKNHKLLDVITLSQEQEDTYKQITILEEFNNYLLDGITGSGKTEIYLKTIIKVLNESEKDAQALIMLPEIGLSTQTLARLKKYFINSVEVIEWHSDVKQSNRYYNWQKIFFGRARIIIGARSALFLPYKNLKIIIVDEEHDSSYKDDQGEFTHNARDMAIVKAKILNIPIILSSATPSLETLNNTLENRCTHIKLTTRYGGAQLPQVKLINMIEQNKILDYISEELYYEIKNTLSLNKQVLLFLNRRGYAPVVLCKACGAKVGCPNCSVWMIKHKNAGVLQCHMCGFKKQYLPVCEACGQADKMLTYGVGVEQVEEAIIKLFPEKNNGEILVLSSDTKDIAQNIEDILSNKVSIIIGTQIAAKGYHFPDLKLVGIIDADSSFYGGDLRAGEKTFQILSQVMGRSGRVKDGKGIVIIQSYNTSSVTLNAIANFDKQSFYNAELKNRKEANMPPFSRLASITCSAIREEEIIPLVTHLGRCLMQHSSLTAFGPTKSAIYCCRKYYRYKFLFIAKKNFNIQQYIQNWLSNAHLPKNHKTKIQVDIDPINFM